MMRATLGSLKDQGIHIPSSPTVRVEGGLKEGGEWNRGCRPDQIRPDMGFRFRLGFDRREGATTGTQLIMVMTVIIGKVQRSAMDFSGQVQ